MRQKFSQMYLIVSIGHSYMERLTELFIKKFFFQYDGHPIFQPLNLPPPPILQNKYRSHIKLVVNNKFPQHKPS